MPVYKISAADLAKIRECHPYGFLADNATVDHGTHHTITLSPRSRDLLWRKFGIVTVHQHSVHHIMPAAAAPATAAPVAPAAPAAPPAAASGSTTP